MALDDFYPAWSDIDFVAVSAAPASPNQITALERVHVQLAGRHPRPSFDGTYVTWDERPAGPSPAGRGPPAMGSELRHHVSGERHPVTWNSLARHGITQRGQRAQDLTVDTDPARLAAWTDGNLDIYWRPWWNRRSRLLSGPGLASRGSWAPQWGVLGVSRLHHTLATGRITSKRGAGEYARTTFDARWHRIIDESVRIRTGAKGRSLYPSPFTRRAHALDFMDMAIDDAHQAARR